MTWSKVIVADGSTRGLVMPNGSDHGLLMHDGVMVFARHSRSSAPDRWYVYPLHRGLADFLDAACYAVMDDYGTLVRVPGIDGE